MGAVGSDEKIEIAKANGCAHVINYSKENFAEKVKEITKGKVFLLFMMELEKKHLMNQLNV